MDALTRLALDARDGDELSLEGFIRRGQADVWRLAAHLVDRASADDITQEVFLRAVPALRRYRGDAPARLWLLTITRRTCADVLRRRIRYRRLQDRLADRGAGVGMTAGVADAASVDLSPTDQVELAALLAELDGDRRSAFVLTQLLGLSYADAADVCGVPVGTIRSRVARARSQLAAHYLADGDDRAAAAD